LDNEFLKVFIGFKVSAFAHH